MSIPVSIPVRPIVLVGLLASGLLASGLLASLPAQAQLLGLGFESSIDLTRQDLDILRQTVNRKIHGHAVGATAAWSNPDSGNYGTIRLLRKYNSGSRHCESVRYSLATNKRAVAAEHYTFDSCLQPDGSWKIS